MKAAQAGSKPIVARLIDANADLNVLDDCNRTARDRAELVEMAAVAEVLKNHGGLLGDQVLEATSPRERERLISNAGRVKRTSRFGRLRSLSDSKMERAHRSSRNSFSKSLGSPTHAARPPWAPAPAHPRPTPPPTPRRPPSPTPSRPSATRTSPPSRRPAPRGASSSPSTNHRSPPSPFLNRARARPAPPRARRAAPPGRPFFTFFTFSTPASGRPN